MREFTVVTAHEKLATHYAHRVFLSSGFWVDVGEFLLMVTETDLEDYRYLPFWDLFKRLYVRA